MRFPLLINLQLLLILTIMGSQAIAQVNPVNSAYLELKETHDAGAEWQLEARQIPLAQVLDRIAKQTRIPVHYSVLPEGLVTATCVGTSLKAVLACVLNHKADLIVRYSKNQPVNNNGQIVEAWVLGSKLDGYPVTRMDCVVPTNTSSPSGEPDKKETLENEQLQTTLKTAKSDIPEERADAIGNLLAVGHDGNEEIKAVLEDALHDQDANVRAQAISTITHRGDYEETAAVIQEALKDSSVDVRMMAVDGITDDVALLQQAVNDSDETVSSLAQLKLDELIKENNRKR